MTQKEAIKSIFQSMEWKQARYALIMEWLEDINWHSENRLLGEKVPADWIRTLDTLQEFDYALRPANYSQPYIKSIEVELAKYSEAVKNYREGRPVFVGLEVFNESLIYQYHNAKEFYRALSYIWGWGLDDSWKNTRGPELVEDIYSLIMGE